jgi:uncharacterized SAM-binding protein YcdF (DUF218 family)
MNPPARHEPEPRSERDVIVVLGCRVLASGEPTAAARRRVEAATAAFHRGVAPRVLTSGGRRWSGRIEARVLAHELGRGGVPATAIDEELWSLTTYENAIFSAAWLSRRWARPRVALVTCAWHMPRALRCFVEAGVDAIAVPAEAPDVGLVARTTRDTAERVRASFDAFAMRGRATLERAADAVLEGVAARGGGAQRGGELADSREERPR